ncbi:AraC family transcriptional regulator [Bacillus sp. SD088]|uniref:AraC family transcriptional regulator n=1 Tax=Bacillus sp. SD088 TaxID=2782012 RepID=UPI001A96749B|nr:AraC family transcriptional regulator [Bacillus sp. SD088]MBO0996034.1 helix-turn-helix transcriptional regulator [Bacillus sp. SD088]
MVQKHLKESTFIPDKTFPINVFYTNGIHLHWHDHMEWVMIKEGKAVVQIDDVFVHLKKGEIALFHPKQLHAAHVLEADTRLIAIVFNEAIIRNSGLDNTENLYFFPYFNEQIKMPNFLRKEDAHTKEIRKSISNLIDEFERKETGYELMVKSELYRTFSMIFRNYAYIEDVPASRIQKKYKLTTLLNYLRENFYESISVEEAAKMVNLSPNHFCKVFKKVTGKTLIEYLNILRVYEAEKMLAETDWSIMEIAEKVGYESVTYFGRVFKQVKGMPPSAKRKMFRQEEFKIGK